MANADITSVAWWISNLGPAGAIIFVLAYGMRSVWVFIKPYVEKILAGHIELMTALEQSLRDQSSAVIKLSDIQEKQYVKIEEIHRVIMDESSVIRRTIQGKS
jgi:hypothetical protein